MNAKIGRTGLLVVSLFALFLGLGDARAESSDVESAWRLLDYIGIDYEGAVANGAVINQVEYDEQIEFAATVEEKLNGLEEKPGRQALLDAVTKLQEAIAAREDAPDVAKLAHSLADQLLAVYPVPLAPATPPEFKRGKKLYEMNCASCHGSSGDGLGPAGVGLEIPPIAFTDKARARQRSLFGLYQVISQGLDDTPMISYGYLPSEDRWALAFYSGHFAFTGQSLADGKALWNSDEALRARIKDLKDFVSLSPQALAEEIGEEKADAVTAYLRQNPALLQPRANSLSLTRERLAQSLDVYRTGDRARAASLALSAYLDGFEPVEPIIAARNGALLNRVEAAMAEYRAGLSRGDDVEVVAARAEAIDSLLVEAESLMGAGAGTRISTFIGAATILLREGVEAMLILVAMIAFLRQTGRPEAVGRVHGGWTSALLAGVATWALATWVIGISGASREMTEGFGSVVAALVLLSVGIWMHGSSQADHWQKYIRKKTEKALSGRSGWLLFGLAFLVTYREVFETILFYVALWSEGNSGALVAGAVTASVLLAIIAWVLMRYSRMLPIGKFFRYSAWLIAVLAVVLAGKGIAALQEAGVVGIHLLSGAPRIPLLGLYPTIESIGAQAAILVALVASFAVQRRKL